MLMNDGNVVKQREEYIRMMVEMIRDAAKDEGVKTAEIVNNPEFLSLGYKKFSYLFLVAAASLRQGQSNLNEWVIAGKYMMTPTGIGKISWRDDYPDALSCSVSDELFPDVMPLSEFQSILFKLKFKQTVKPRMYNPKSGIFEPTGRHVAGEMLKSLAGDHS